jgi:hypothetical protein
MFKKCPYCFRYIEVDDNEVFVKHSILEGGQVECKVSGKTKKQFLNEVFLKKISDCFLNVGD